MKEGGREGRKGGKAGPRKLQNVFFFYDSDFSTFVKVRPCVKVKKKFQSSLCHLLSPNIPHSGNKGLEAKYFIVVHMVPLSFDKVLKHLF